MWSTTEIYGRFHAWSHCTKFLQLRLFFIVVSFKLLEVTTTLSQAIFQVVSSGSNKWQDAVLVARQLEDKIVFSNISESKIRSCGPGQYLERHSFVGGFRDK